MSNQYLKDGKVKKCKVLPSGMYVYDRERGMPRMIDAAYEGFKIIWERENQKERATSHQIITDACELKSMADGKTYTSKSQYYASLKQADAHIVEKGEHKPPRSGEIKGDFGCRKELRDALKQHLPHMR